MYACMVLMALNMIELMALNISGSFRTHLFIILALVPSYQCAGLIYGNINAQ